MAIKIFLKHNKIQFWTQNVLDKKYTIKHYFCGAVQKYSLKQTQNVKTNEQKKMYCICQYSTYIYVSVLSGFLKNRKNWFCISFSTKNKICSIAISLNK